MAAATTRNLTRVTLDLSEDEAQALADILAKVGGNPERSRRGHAESISNALLTAGITWKRGERPNGSTIGPTDMSGGGILFHVNEVESLCPFCPSCDQPRGYRHPCDVG